MRNDQISKNSGVGAEYLRTWKRAPQGTVDIKSSSPTSNDAANVEAEYLNSKQHNRKPSIIKRMTDRIKTQKSPAASYIDGTAGNLESQLENNPLTRSTTDQDDTVDWNPCARTHEGELFALQQAPAVSGPQYVSSTKLDEPGEMLRHSTSATVNMGAFFNEAEADMLQSPVLGTDRDFLIEYDSGKTAVRVDPTVLPLDEQYPGPMTWQDLVTWDDECEQSDISQRAMRGESTEQDLCRRCRRLGLVEQDGMTDNQSIQYQPFGTWLQLLLRNRCKLCRLIAVSIAGGTSILPPNLDSIAPEHQFIQLLPTTLASGERAIVIEFGMKRVGMLRLIKSENYWEVLRQAYEIRYAMPFHQLLDGQGVFHDASGQVASTQLIKSWVKECEKKHGNECNYPYPVRDAGKQLSIFLIDVVENCLVEHRMETTRYVTLSYVSGQCLMPSTTTSNFDERQLEGSLECDIPPTIRDAITVVKLLDERYLWVDSLCIIQDDARSRRHNIKNMDAIFSNAVVTIVALAGTDANAGLPGIRPGTRPPQAIEAPQLPTRSCGPSEATIQEINRLARDDPDKYRDCLYPSHLAVRRTNEIGVVGRFISKNEFFEPHQGDNATREGWPFIVAHPPSLEQSCGSSTWNTRGWTLQEQMLSRRCIYFGSDYVYFQCGRHNLCETGGNHTTCSIASADNHTTQRNLAWKKNPLLQFRTPSIPTMSMSMSNRNSFGAMLHKHNFGAYAKIIEAYSKRNLDNSADILDAVKGVLNVIKGSIGGKMVTGMPSRYFDLALLWSPTGPQQRLTMVGRTDNTFPSWSWASWSGSKQYYLATTSRSSLDTLQCESAVSTVNHFTVRCGTGCLHIYKDCANMNALGAQGPGYQVAEHEKMSGRYLPYLEHASSEGSGIDDLPWTLEFSTFAADARGFRLNAFSVERMTAVDESLYGKQTAQKLFDVNGKHCGVLYGMHGDSARHQTTINSMEYIMISSMPHFGHRQDSSRSAATMSEFTFNFSNSSSGMINVMLLENFGSFYERISVGQIHRQAWEAAQPVYKRVVLM